MQAPIEIPNFELVKEIGKGGMAVVYLGRQQQPRRKVAIKIVSPGPQQDESFLQSLKLEGDNAAQCSHPNIVTVYACGVIDEHYYLAMEFLDGGDLAARIVDGIDEKAALRIMREMAGALQHAHKRKLLHRDIKPENIMFDDADRAVLVDWGIAKEADTESNFTKAGAVVGTPHYMSPERATGKAIDQRSDIYALGVVFYEMLTGKKLYDGADTYAISFAHVYDPIPQLSGAHAKYQGLLNKMVAKDPNDRFQDADALLKALDSAKGQPATAATMAVASSDLASTQHMSREELEASRARTGEPSGKPVGLYAGIAAVVLALAVAAYLFMPSGGNDPVQLNTRLTAEQAMEMQDKLAAAQSFARMGDYDRAANLFAAVLTDFECDNEEARRGLQALDPELLAAVAEGCE